MLNAGYTIIYSVYTYHNHHEWCYYYNCYAIVELSSGIISVVTAIETHLNDCVTCAALIRRRNLPQIYVRDDDVQPQTGCRMPHDLCDGVEVEFPFHFQLIVGIFVARHRAARAQVLEILKLTHSRTHAHLIAEAAISGSYCCGMPRARHVSCTWVREFG